VPRTSSKALRAEGRTIAARIEFWRSRSWAELEALMRAPGGDDDATTGSPTAATLTAPPVRVVLQS